MIALLGKKVGMTEIFDQNGNMVPVTLIQVEDNVVLGKRSLDKHGYNATIIGAFKAKPKRLTKPVLGQIPKGLEPVKKMKEIRDFEIEANVGDKLSVEIFKDVKYVDVCGLSKGRGYQGVIKRHNFAGGTKSHGSKFHREMGSTGQHTFPAHTFKRKKMPGHMGNTKVTVQNLRVVMIDPEKKMLVVKGAVSGARENILLVAKAKRK